MERLDGFMARYECNYCGRRFTLLPTDWDRCPTCNDSNLKLLRSEAKKRNVYGYSEEDGGSEEPESSEILDVYDEWLKLSKD